MRAAGGPEDFRVIGTPTPTGRFPRSFRARAFPAALAGAEARPLIPRPVPPLQIALTRLAKHYGLISSETQKPARRGLRHWGSEDYRPTLDAWRSGARAEGES